MAVEQIIDYGQRAKGVVQVSAGQSIIWNDESDFSFDPYLDGRVSINRTAFVPIRAGNKYQIKHGVSYVFDRNQRLAIQFPPSTFDPDNTETPGYQQSQVIDPANRLSGSQFVKAGDVVVWEDTEYYAFSPTTNCRVSIANNVFIDLTAGERIIIRHEFDYVFDRDIMLEVGFPPTFFEYPSIGAGGTVPIGTIVMYSGSYDDIPTNWAVCDGNNGTPNLTEKFIMGAYMDENSNNIGDTGGNKDAAVIHHTHSATQSEHNHTRGDMEIAGSFDNRKTDFSSHDYYTTEMPQGAFGFGSNSGTRYGVVSSDVQYDYKTFDFKASRYWTGSTSSRQPAITVEYTGESGTDKNLPPFYKLAYIRRMS